MATRVSAAVATATAADSLALWLCEMCPGGASLSCCNVAQIVSRFMQIREFMSCSPLSHFKRIFWAACNTLTLTHTLTG